MSYEEIAEAVWESVSRTLASGSPSPPANGVEEVAKAVWEYETRTLTGTGPRIGRVIGSGVKGG